jgi:hypothetical protein
MCIIELENYQEAAGDIVWQKAIMQTGNDREE